MAIDPVPAPKWRRRKEARPAEIVAAALEVFVEKGFAAARLEAIAERAGVSKGALYLYFETKQDIFAAVVREAVSPRFAILETLSTSYTGDIAALSRAFIPVIAASVSESPIGKVVKMVIGESGNFPELARIWHDDVIAPALDLLTRVIENAQARGEIRPCNPRHAALSLISPMLVSVLFRETFVPVGAKPFDIPDLMSDHVETVLAGLLSKEPAP